MRTKLSATTQRHRNHFFCGEKSWEEELVSSFAKFSFADVDVDVDININTFTSRSSYELLTVYHSKGI